MAAVAAADLLVAHSAGQVDRHFCAPCGHRRWREVDCFLVSVKLPTTGRPMREIEAALEDLEAMMLAAPSAVWTCARGGASVSSAAHR